MIKSIRGKLFKILGVVAVIAMLATAMLVAPVAAISGVVLTIGSTEIYNNTPYTISFTLGTTQPADAAGIVVTFDTGIMVGTPAVTIMTGPGTGSTAMALTTITADTTIVGQTATINTLNGTVPIGAIGAGTTVQLIFTNITNPADIGSYSVTLSTAAEPTAVTSNIITTTPASTGGPLPGVASVYNTASTPVLMKQFNSLDSAITAAESVSGGAIIKLTAGTYIDSNTNTPYIFANPVTIQGDDPSVVNVEIIAAGDWAINGTTVVIDRVTIDGKKGVLTVSGSKSVTVSNSIIGNGVLTIGATGTGTSNITNDDFVVNTGATGLSVTSATTVAGSTFNLTGQGGYGISAPFDVTVTGSTFIGATNSIDYYLGNGILVSGSVNGSTISTSTFTRLSNALTVNGVEAMATFNGNIVTNCGQGQVYSNSTVSTAAITVGIAAANGVNIYGNTITNGTYYILDITTANTVDVSGNTFTGNAKTVKSADTANTLLMARNWWGGAANVPANVKSVTGITAGITYTPGLGSAPSSSAFAVIGVSATNPIAAATTVGVNITASTGAGMVGATALTGNPVSIAIPSSDTVVKYWDVYGVQPDGKTALTSATVDFYGTTIAPVNSNSAVFFYNTTNGTWVNTDAIPNVNDNYMEISVGTDGNITAAQFTGTPFALVIPPANKTTTVVVTTAVAQVTTITITNTTPIKGKPVIQSSLLWGIIAVEAVLVIVVVILIVKGSKTRNILK
jgi:hypothetical protein